jgi:hypothetical protein
VVSTQSTTGTTIWFFFFFFFFNLSGFELTKNIILVLGSVA